MTDIKQKMIKQIDVLLDLLDFGTDPIGELEELRDALTSTDAADWAEWDSYEDYLFSTISNTVQGCDTGSSRLIEIGHQADLLDDFIIAMNKLSSQQV